MRVVIDTNVIVSGFLFGGMPAEVLTLAASGVIAPCFTDATIEEAYTTFAKPNFEKYKKGMPISVETMLYSLVREAPRFPTPIDIPAYIVRDPSDNHFLACALAAQAECIISGDKHLLDLKNFAGIPILTPRQFLKRFHDIR